jgi:hypothetical protein
LQSRLYLDFREDDSFDASLAYLLKVLHGIPFHEKPPLGPLPTFVSGEKSAPLPSTVKLKTTTPVSSAPNQVSLASFKDLYDFAYSPTGMNLSRSEAQTWAENWLKSPTGDFDRFREAYGFAYSPAGMNLSRTEAQEWAESWYKKPKEDLERFKEAYEFGYRPGGLNLTRTEAQGWANKWLSQNPGKEFHK